MTKATYRNCTINKDYPPIPGEWWSWSHKDYDGAPDGGDNRCGFENSFEACKERIDEMYEEGDM